MYLTAKNQLKHLSVLEHQTLRTLCRLSKNLYNEVLTLSVSTTLLNVNICVMRAIIMSARTALTTKLLGLEIAQQTLKVVDRCFKSFFVLVRKAKSASYQFNMVKLPHYLSKEG